MMRLLLFANRIYWSIDFESFYLVAAMGIKKSATFSRPKPSPSPSVTSTSTPVEDIDETITNGRQTRLDYARDLLIAIGVNSVWRH